MTEHTYDVLVLGGGITGVSAASRLSSAGLQVHLVERADHLGGRALEFGCKATDACQKCNVFQVAQEQNALFVQGIVVDAVSEVLPIKSEDIEVEPAVPLIVPPLKSSEVYSSVGADEV